MCDRSTAGCGSCREGIKLRDHARAEHLGVELEAAPAELDAIRVRDVRADTHPCRDRPLNRDAHGALVTGVATARHVCRGDSRKQHPVSSDAVCIIGLADVGVHVDAHGAPDVTGRTTREPCPHIGELLRELDRSILSAV